MSPEALAAHLEEKAGVAFALLFGSRDRGSARTDSDWDVGLYFDERLDRSERLTIRRRLAAALPMCDRIDLVDLNSASALLGQQAISGRKLVVNDPSAYIRYFVKTLGEVEDERFFGAIHRRARRRRLEEGRLVDREVFDRRLGAFEQTLSDLRGAAEVSRATFLENRGRQAQVERWCQVLVEIALDLAHHLIADRGWESPRSYREAFEVLARHDVLTAELAEQISAWAGLRNLLVHLYLEVDHDLLYTIVTTELDQMEAFAHAMSRSALD